MKSIQVWLFGLFPLIAIASMIATDFRSSLVASNDWRDLSINGRGYIEIVDGNGENPLWARSVRLGVNQFGLLCANVKGSLRPFEPPIHVPSGWTRIEIDTNGQIKIGTPGSSEISIGSISLVYVAQKQGAIVSRVHALGGTVRYDFDFFQSPSSRGLLSSIFGPNFSGQVLEVDFRHCTIADSDLLVLKDLKAMTRLGLYDTSISNEGLKTVGTFHQLEFLWLDKTVITDDGIKHLVDLQQLKELLVQNTSITDDATTPAGST